MKESLRVSIIIPTFNRKQCLNNVINEIYRSQDYSNFELIIVDQSDQYDREECKKGLDKYGKSLLYCIVDFKSLTRARNYGISVSTGDIVLFLDDDVEVSNSLISEHVQSYKKYPKLGGVAGRVIEDPDVFTNTKRLGAHISFTGRCFRNFNSYSCGFVDAAVGCNMSFDKRIMEKVGLFDENYIGTSELEETDYCYRVRKLGVSIFYNHKAALKHLISKDGGCRTNFVDREYFKMHNLGLFFAKHKSILLFSIFVFFTMLTIIKRVFMNVKNNRFKTFQYIFKGLLDGYFAYLPFKR